MTLSPTTNSWSTQRTLVILDQLKMDFINSSQFKNTEVHILLLTQNTLEVAIIYLLNGKLGRSHGPNIMADDPYSCAVYAKNLTYFTHKDGSNSTKQLLDS